MVDPVVWSATITPPPASAAKTVDGNPPLILDLDHDLLRTDPVLEGLLAAAKKQPWILALYPVWRMQGRAVLQRKLTERVTARADLLPLNAELVQYATAQHAAGRLVYLTARGDDPLGRVMAERLDYIDDVIEPGGLADRFPGGFLAARDVTQSTPERPGLKTWRRALR